MTLVRWQPFRNVTTLQREMDRLFENLTERDENSYSITFAPAAELKTDAGNIYLQLELPGLQPEDIEVEVNAEYVTVSGERKQSQTTVENGIKRSEFRYGKFKRTIALPHKVDRDLVQAKYEHGVLKLTLPKVEDDKNKTVKVLVAAS
jgi:HSP20 family protein